MLNISPFGRDLLLHVIGFNNMLPQKNYKKTDGSNLQANVIGDEI